MKQLTIFILAVALCCSCSKDDYIDVKFDRETFFEQKQLWQASNTKDYEYHLSSFDIAVKVIVENGFFLNAETLNGNPVFAGFADSGYSTIDAIYDKIEDEFNLYNGTKKSGFYLLEIVVEYDKINHIPIRIDYCYYHSLCPTCLSISPNKYYEITNFDRLEEIVY